MAPTNTTGRARYQTVGQFLGPAVAAVLLVVPPPADLPVEGWRAAALGLCMAVWWATEAIPAAVTALVPIALFPLFGVADIATVAVISPIKSSVRKGVL